MLKTRFRSLSCALLGAAFATTTVMLPTMAEAQKTTNAQSLGTSSKVLVQGPVNTAAGAAAGTFSGILNVTHFAVQNGQIVATGLLTGTITDATGATTAVNQSVIAPVTSASAGCPILNLTLGPLHVNVLGLVIDLNQVNLNIVAQPGAGNLLGNLLCAVANLLNNGGPLQAIVNDLNNILGAL